MIQFDLYKEQHPECEQYDVIVAVYKFIRYSLNVCNIDISGYISLVILPPREKTFFRYGVTNGIAITNKIVGLLLSIIDVTKLLLARTRMTDGAQRKFTDSPIETATRQGNNIWVIPRLENEHGSAKLKVGVTKSGRPATRQGRPFMTARTGYLNTDFVAHVTQHPIGLSVCELNSACLRTSHRSHIAKLLMCVLVGLFASRDCKTQHKAGHRFGQRASEFGSSRTACQQVSKSETHRQSCY